VSIPELIRLLMLEGLGFDEAFEITRKTFSYTNHTVMQEALEKWDVNLLRDLLPEIYDIIWRINTKLCGEIMAKGLDCEPYAIVSNNIIRMANLAVYASSYVNGVAEIHTQILKDDVLKIWYQVYPERFQNKTNGITQRRWLGLCNPELSKYITERIGGGWIIDLEQLKGLKAFMSDKDVEEFIAVKREKKRQLRKLILAREGVDLPESFCFDVQVKRMHEYKRQLMNAFAILDIYFGIKDGRIQDFPPTAFLFGAKAAPGYIIAKTVIKFINEIANLINNDESVNDRMRVVFVQNYNCSYAEHIIPAADISEQISPAGTEASGTGNMKLMLNGAVSLCTYDGANIEILDAAGEENNYLFGARVDTLNELRPHYDPKAIYDHEPRVKRVVDTLINGTFDDGGTGVFRSLYNSLVSGNSWQRPDYYFVLYELLPYIDRKLDAIYDTQDPLTFGRKALMNTASAGYFSSDRTILDYARDIWDLKPFPHQYTLKLF
ncbi:MAG: glycogen/starch/alpha-glucan family phosphorylase, partial [Clostridia bacterium]|nr:glycogen/starch/alpha-glucan family phosphorylase [Clostridia bacterium]